MRKIMRFGMVIGCLALFGAVAATGQEGVQCAIQQGGALAISLGAEKLGVLELNAHGPEWKYVSQTAATAEVKAAEAGKGEVITGRLLVPGAEGGAVVFTETVTPGEKQVEVAYDLSFSQVMTVNGLQFSLLLPIKPYAGKSLVVRTGEGEKQGTLAQILNREQWQLMTVKGTEVKIASGDPEEITITSDREATIAICDLRRWDREEFEIRFALLTEDKGKQMTAADSYQTKLTLAFAEPVTLTKP